MSADIIEQKAALRREVRARLALISPEQRALASQEICSRLRTPPVWNSARTILFFAPLADEPDIWPLLAEAMAAGKSVALPRYFPETQTYVAAQILNVAKDLRSGQLGIREPLESCREIPLGRLDFVLVPGVAFDAAGGRLGRGRGFYDRLLAAVTGKKCGVAFDEQLVGEIPMGPLDVRMDFIATPTRWIEI